MVNKGDILHEVLAALSTGTNEKEEFDLYIPTEK